MNRFYIFKIGLVAITLCGAIALFYYVFILPDIKYNNYQSIKIGDNIEKVKVSMGKEDFQYKDSFYRGGQEVLIYQYSMGPIAPDDLKILIKSDTVVEKIYNQ